MFKEKQIIAEYPFTKQDLVELRKSSDFAEGIDWLREKTIGTKSGAVCWTMKGMLALLVSKGLQPSVALASEGSAVTVPIAEPKPKVAVEKCVAILRRKYPNHKVVDCEIRGQKALVKVWDSRNMLINSIIDVEKTDCGWISRTKVDNRGKVHAKTSK